MFIHVCRVTHAIFITRLITYQLPPRCQVFVDVVRGHETPIAGCPLPVSLCRCDLLRSTTNECSAEGLNHCPYP